MRNILKGFLNPPAEEYVFPDASAIEMESPLPPGLAGGEEENEALPEELDIPLPAPEPEPLQEEEAPPASGSFVWDDANALSDRTVRELDERNDRLWDRHNVTVAVVTCDNQRELGEYAYRQAEKMGLGGYDMVVALDIRGDNYWLLLGNDVGRDFPYDPSEYAYEYMENAFVRRDYDDAVLELTQALEDWYGKQYR